MRTLSNSILRLEHELEIAIEEILNDFERKTPLKIKNIKLLKCHDDMGPYYEIKVITQSKVKND